MSTRINTTSGKLSVGTVFRVVGIGLVFSIVPLTILMGIFASFGAETIVWNEQPVTGVKGLLASPFVGLFIAGIFTMFIGSFIALGLWLFSFFRPLEISVKQAQAKDES